MVLKNLDFMKKRLAATAFFLCVMSFCFALKVPELTGRVNDTAKLMSSREKQEAEDYLKQIEEKTGSQVVILTIKNLQGESLEDYSLKVAEKWGIGRKGSDNGVLLLVSYDDRAIRLEVGYGLEGCLTDTKCGLIIRTIIIPEFKEGDYGEGILKGVKAVGGIIEGDADTENNLKQAEAAAQDEGIAGAFFAMIFILVWFLMVFSVIVSRMGLWNIFIWTLLGRKGPKPKIRRYTYTPNPNVTVHHTGFSGGGGSFGGGGFSGGGGHFGGGGASGHW